MISTLHNNTEVSRGVSIHWAGVVHTYSTILTLLFLYVYARCPEVARGILNSLRIIHTCVCTYVYRKTFYLSLTIPDQLNIVFNKYIKQKGLEFFFAPSLSLTNDWTVYGQPLTSKTRELTGAVLSIGCRVGFGCRTMCQHLSREACRCLPVIIRAGPYLGPKS